MAIAEKEEKAGPLPSPCQPSRQLLGGPLRTFIWAAKLNLPPSCQGTEAVREEKRKRGKKQREEASGQAFRAPVTPALPAQEALRLPGQPARALDTSRGPAASHSGVQARNTQALGPRPRRPSSVPCRRSEVGREGKGEKSLIVSGRGRAGRPCCLLAFPLGRVGGPGSSPGAPRPPALGRVCLPIPWSVF